jgi:hypothetical protein
MPTCLEHWAAMPPTTCYGYKRRYLDVESIKKQIIIHGKSAGVIISDDIDGPGLLLDDFIKASPKQVSRKRPRIQAQPVAVVIQLPDVNDSTEQPMAQSQVPMQEANQFMDQVQPIVHTAEQPIADAAPVPMVQPIYDAALSTQIEELQVNAADCASANAIAHPYAHCTNTNGAEIIEFVLKLSNGADFNVPVRRDGYVNVTKICQAAGKRLQHYKDRIDSKHVLDRFVALTGIPANAIFEVFQGGNLANVEQGTFAHPDIAIHIAQWCSADFSIQVSIDGSESYLLLVKLKLVMS